MLALCCTATTLPTLAQSASASTVLRVDPGLNRSENGTLLAGVATAFDQASAPDYAVSASATAGSGSISTFTAATTRASSSATAFGVIGSAGASLSDSFTVQANGNISPRILLDFAVSATGDVSFSQFGNDTSSFGALARYSIGLSGGALNVSITGSVERGRQIDIETTRATQKTTFKDYEIVKGRGLNPETPMLLTMELISGGATTFSLSMSSEVIASVKRASNMPGSFMSAAGDFGHTLKWLGLSRAYLPDGTPYTGALNFSSASGYDYGRAVTAVPEPAHWALLLGGLGLLAWRTRQPD